MGGLDLVVNVVGKQVWQESICDIIIEQFDVMFKINVYVMFWICKVVLEYLLFGVLIINIVLIQFYDFLVILVDYVFIKVVIVVFIKVLVK